MGFNFNNETPIYMQIIEYIKMQIISKKYLPNEKLPSVRELACELEVNPNTVQKALGELEDMQLIFTERTNGKFVTNDENLINNLKNETIRKMLNNFYESMQKIGLEKNEILEIINNDMKE